ncbi:MAG: hypothetical protein J6S19_00670, partial [Lentisphaeria bacterium]|nr:hypothetical protein [Lentisphaeria bacterium]
MKSFNRSMLFSVLVLTVFQLCGCCTTAVESGLNNPNAYCGSDSEKIEKALAYAAKNSLPLEITRRTAGDERDFWLIDRAILLPENMELRIVNCRIKLSDICRDNIIRSANCIRGLDRVKKIRNIRITGVGKAVLEGADRPRSTGDSGKVLGERTFGTDAGKAGVNPKADWRNIGVLLVDVDDFEISNIRVVNSHCWAISLEYCRRGKVSNVGFFSTGAMLIDGKMEVTLNQDGLDLRRGCQYIDIENIYGCAGDDLIALTAIGVGKTVSKTGDFKSTMFSAAECRGADDDVHHINIRNVSGYSAGNCHIVRLLNNRGVKIHHVVIDNVVDRSPNAIQNRAVVRIGDSGYGGFAPLGDTSNITVRNIYSNAQHAVLVHGSLADSVIENITLRRHWAPVISFGGGKDSIRNVKLPPNLMDKATREKNTTPYPKGLDPVSMYFPEPPHVKA